MGEEKVVAEVESFVLLVHRIPWGGAGTCLLLGSVLAMEEELGQCWWQRSNLSAHWLKSSSKWATWR